MGPIGVKRTLAAVLGAVLGLALVAPAAGASNDAMDTPDVLTFQSSVTGTTTNFTTEPPEKEPLCPSMTATAWWVFRGNGRHVVVSTDGSAGNTVLSVYRKSSMVRMDGCNDDVSQTERWSRVEFDSAREDYLVQVGANIQTGFVRVSVSGARPANDDRAAATPVATGQLHDSGRNEGATAEAGEVLACQGRYYGATVWYRWTAPAVGEATFVVDSLSDLGALQDTVLAVYRFAGSTPIVCNDDRDHGGEGSGATLPVQPGEYAIQVGAYGRDSLGDSVAVLPIGNIRVKVDFSANPDVDGDGSKVPDDCNDADPSIHPGAYDIPTDDIDQDCNGSPSHDGDGDGYDWNGPPRDCDDGNRAIHPGAFDIPDNGVDEDCSGRDGENLDRDGDGYNRPTDCDDSNPRIHPGAEDEPHNGVNEDCVDGDADYPLLGTRVLATFAQRRGYDVVTGLWLQRARARSIVRIRCLGSRCHTRARTVRVSRDRARLSLPSAVRGQHLRRGVVFEVTVTRASTIGAVSRWTFRSLAKPVHTELCQWPDERKPRACPK